MNTKLKVKAAWSKGLERSGMMSVLERRRLSGHACLLMYHRVLADPGNQPIFVQPGMYVTPESFERQILFLKQRFKLMFLDEIVQRQAAGESIAGCCAITFDDGWRDNYMEAFPLLKAHAVPATIFLATGFVGTDRMFWPEEMLSYLGNIKSHGYRLTNKSRTFETFRDDIRRSWSRSRVQFFERCLGRIKTYSPQEREELFVALRAQIGMPQVGRLVMTWEEAAEMQQSGLVRFGSHSVNHEMLDRIAPETLRDELLESRLEIENRLGESAAIFAYPNGNANGPVREAVRACGYLGAVTTRRGLMASQSPLLALPRIGIHEDVSDSLSLFRHRLLAERSQ